MRTAIMAIVLALQVVSAWGEDIPPADWAELLPVAEPLPVAVRTEAAEPRSETRLPAFVRASEVMARAMRDAGLIWLPPKPNPASPLGIQARAGANSELVFRAALSAWARRQRFSPQPIRPEQSLNPSNSDVFPNQRVRNP